MQITSEYIKRRLANLDIEYFRYLSNNIPIKGKLLYCYSNDNLFKLLLKEKKGIKERDFMNMDDNSLKYYENLDLVIYKVSDPESIELSSTLKRVLNREIVSINCAHHEPYNAIINTNFLLVIRNG